MQINKDGSCRYRGVTYRTVREALQALWAKHEKEERR